LNFLSTLENILTTIIIIMMCYLTYLLFKIQREDIEFLLQLKKKIHEQRMELQKQRENAEVKA